MFLVCNMIIGKLLVKNCPILYPGKCSRLEKQIKNLTLDQIDKLATKHGNGFPEPLDSLNI